MKVADLDQTVEGKRIRCIRVAESQAEAMGFCDDTKRLLNQTGKACMFNKGRYADWAQLVVDWDDDEPGRLMLSGDDEVEVIEQPEETAGG